jgi:hypothetical protein
MERGGMGSNDICWCNRDNWTNLKIFVVPLLFQEV